MTSIFGSIHACKQLFSTMKLAKTKLVVAQPSDEHLLRCYASFLINLSPEHQKLSNKTPHEMSH